MAVAGVGGEGGRGGGEGGGVVHGPVEQRLRAGRVAEVALNLGSHLWERERGAYGWYRIARSRFANMIFCAVKGGLLH